MELRKCCNHAYLNRGVEDRILVEIPEAQRTKETIHKQLVSHSGKLILLDKLLPRLKAEGHKVRSAMIGLRYSMSVQLVLTLVFLCRVTSLAGAYLFTDGESLGYPGGLPSSLWLPL